MQEQTLTTHLAEDIPVTVYYDYIPGQLQTHTDPPYDAEVIINEVLIDNNHRLDILPVLSSATVLTLELECYTQTEKGEE